MVISDARKRMEAYKVEPRKRQICIDIDGCICEYDFPKIVKKFFDVDIFPSMIFAYDLADVLGVSPRIINIMFREQVYGKPHFIPGAIETLKAWKSRGYELIMYSNRVKYMGDLGLAEWLIKYKIPFSGVDGGLGRYDIHIDDSPSKLMATNSAIKLLYTQPWNIRCHNITGKLIRVNNWQEVRDVYS